MGTGGYKDMKGTRRWDGKAPTHYSDKQHPDVGTSARRAGHLPLQTAAVLSRQAEQPRSGRRTAALASWFQRQMMSQLLEAQAQLSLVALEPFSAGHTDPTVTKGSIFLCDARKMQRKSIPLAILHNQLISCWFDGGLSLTTFQHRKKSYWWQIWNPRTPKHSKGWRASAKLKSSLWMGSSRKASKRQSSRKH